MDKQITFPLPGGVPLEMVLVPAGHFIMGSKAEEAAYDENPEHIIHITQPFYIGKYPVTQAQWQAINDNNPSNYISTQRPVELVSWIDIVEGNQDQDGSPAFLNLLNAHFRKSDNSLAATHQFRLPTEAEWEYAAKGGQAHQKEELEGKKARDLYATYVGGDRLGACGWYSENTSRRFDTVVSGFDWCCPPARRWPDSRLTNSKPSGPDTVSVFGKKRYYYRPRYGCW